MIHPHSLFPGFTSQLPSAGKHDIALQGTESSLTQGVTAESSDGLLAFASFFEQWETNRGRIGDETSIEEPVTTPLDQGSPQVLPEAPVVLMASLVAGILDPNVPVTPPPKGSATEWGSPLRVRGAASSAGDGYPAAMGATLPLGSNAVYSAIPQHASLEKQGPNAADSPDAVLGDLYSGTLDTATKGSTLANSAAIAVADPQVTTASRDAAWQRLPSDPSDSPPPFASLAPVPAATGDRMTPSRFRLIADRLSPAETTNANRQDKDADVASVQEPPPEVVSASSREVMNIAAATDRAGDTETAGTTWQGLRPVAAPASHGQSPDRSALAAESLPFTERQREPEVANPGMPRADEDLAALATGRERTWPPASLQAQTVVPRADLHTDAKAVESPSPKQAFPNVTAQGEVLAVSAQMPSTPPLNDSNHSNDSNLTNVSSASSASSAPAAPAINERRMEMSITGVDAAIGDRPHGTDATSASADGTVSADATISADAAISGDAGISGELPTPHAPYRLDGSYLPHDRGEVLAEPRRDVRPAWNETLSADEATRSQLLAAVQTAWQARQAAQEGTMRFALSPEELGWIQVRVEQADSAVHVCIQCARAETEHLIRDHLRELHDSLGQLGVEVGEFHLQRDGSGDPHQETPDRLRENRGSPAEAVPQRPSLRSVREGHHRINVLV